MPVQHRGRRENAHMADALRALQHNAAPQARQPGHRPEGMGTIRRPGFRKSSVRLNDPESPRRYPSASSFSGRLRDRFLACEREVRPSW